MCFMPLRQFKSAGRSELSPEIRGKAEGPVGLAFAGTCAASVPGQPGWAHTCGFPNPVAALLLEVSSPHRGQGPGASPAGRAGLEGQLGSRLPAGP